MAQQWVEFTVRCPAADEERLKALLIGDADQCNRAAATTSLVAENRTTIDEAVAALRPTFGAARAVNGRQ